MKAIVGAVCSGRAHRWAHPKKAGDDCHCGKLRLCNQGWHAVPVADFGTARKNCKACQRKRSRWVAGTRMVAARRGLRAKGELRFLWSDKSGNRKLGPIPAVIVSPETCPPSCGFYGKGCYAEFGVSGMHWRRTARAGIPFGTLLARIMSLPKGTLWRYAVAGDLPGIGNALDLEALALLWRANEVGRGRGFTFTHKPLTRLAERRAIALANQKGFTVNLSADSLEQADERAELGIGPVAVVLPAGASGDIRTPAGRRVVVCPAETRGVSCADCQLCSRANRKGIVGFRAHGQMQRTVSEIARRHLPVVAAPGVEPG